VFELPLGTRRKMETCLGVDFSDIRVFVGRRPLDVQAAAFAVGSDLYFAPGFYDPSSLRGQTLLAHELAHVVQQRSGRACLMDEFELEQEAEWVARRWSNGQRAWLSGRGNLSGAPAVMQCLKLFQLTPETTKLYQKHQAKCPKFPQALEAAKSEAPFKELLNKFEYPGLGFDGNKAVQDFINAQQGPPSTSNPNNNNTSGSPVPKWGPSATTGPKPTLNPTDLKFGQQSATLSPTAVDATFATQSWNEVSGILNSTGKPSNVVSAQKGDSIKCSGETQEVWIRFTLNSQITYKVVLHYHPAPLNTNFLHFKNSPEASTNLKIGWQHWLLKMVNISGPGDVS